MSRAQHWFPALALTILNPLLHNIGSSKYFGNLIEVGASFHQQTSLPHLDVHTPHPTANAQDCGFTPDSLAAVPGPGEYNIDRANSSTHKNRAGTSTPTSSFLCTRTPLNVGTNVETPAPGTYELLRTHQAHVDKSGNVLKDPFFRSRTKRNASFIAASDVPGPGEYDVDRGVATANSFGSGGSRGGGTSGRPGQRRRGGSAHAKEEEDVTPGKADRTPQNPSLQYNVALVVETVCIPLDI